MHLIIDQGNTATKLALFEDTVLIDSIRLSNAELDLGIQNFLRNKNLEGAFGSSVRADEQSIFNQEKFGFETVPFGIETPIPLSISYKTPKTFGLDRIANACGVLDYDKQNTLVVDAGTCTTYTLLKENTIVGGAIAPGLKMRLQAMHQFTGKLPLIGEVPQNITLIGETTEESLLSGGILGGIFEIDAFIQAYCSEINDLFVILTGGESRYLGSRLKSSIFADENLTLKGLNRIYLYNKK
ncbi:MAG: type III pantothenate kinase [Flavobacteriales bacterium]